MRASFHGSLLYNHFMDYEPETGRHVESDPIWLKGGASTYGHTAETLLFT